MLLNANSIYLAEGEWNPGAYKDVEQRAQAMTHALDNTRVSTVPGEFVGSPTPNAWEALGSPDRPHVPGVVEGTVPMPQGSSGVPAIPEPTQEPQAPKDLPPADTEEATPKTSPKKAPEKQYEATEFAPQTYTPVPKPTEKPVQKASFFKLGKPSTQTPGSDASQSSWRAKTSATGKPALK
jgi:hypothetical protein